MADDTMEQIIYNSQGIPRSHTPPRSKTPQNDNNAYSRTSTIQPPRSPKAEPRNELRNAPDRGVQRARYSDFSVQQERQPEREKANNGYPRRESLKDRERRETRQKSESNSNGMTAGTAVLGSNNLTDFFSNEVFHIVLHNPTTAHRFLRFCQSRACGENMEFLQKVDAYIRLLDSVTQTLSSINSTYTSPDAPRQLNLPGSLAKRVNADIKYTTSTFLPNLEEIFADAQEHIQRLLASDIYPRFVKHQVTASATVALSEDKNRYQGLGDCFCLTDPARADNPILFASDGFVSVTGYTRKDIIPRNCRFLQGAQTDPLATKRLKDSIERCEETVELLLNYRKNGDPFWNLLYVSPLFDENGEVKFFLGGQINCSTTIHSCTDVLRVLSVRDDELDGAEEDKSRPESIRSLPSEPPPGNAKFTGAPTSKARSGFFKSFRKYAPSFGKSNVPGGAGSTDPMGLVTTAGSKGVSVRTEAGMENELIKRVGRMNFRTQVEAFYTAYSKYLILAYPPYTASHPTPVSSSASSFTLPITHYSPGIIDLLGLHLPHGAIAPIFSVDIFKILSEHSSSPSSFFKHFKGTVRDALSKGLAVSVELGLLTGYEEVRKGGRFGGAFGGGGASKEMLMVWKRVEERYISHWTPVKDEEGRVGWCVLTIAPKV